jgi:signal transduction histidine kinase/ligand-binding sensor domain-containing protein
MSSTNRARDTCRKGIIIMLLLLSNIYSYPQLNSGNFIQLTEKDGLPGVEVHAVLVDRLGYIWIGTVNGLARYNGYDFKRYYVNPSDTNTIQGLVVWSIFEDSKGHIWAGTNPGNLNEYDPATQQFQLHEFTHLVKHLDNVELLISSICEDDSGRTYYGVDTYYGDPITACLLYKEKNEEELKVFPMENKLGLSNIKRIRKDGNGNIWVISNSGIFRVDKQGKISRFTLLDNELYVKKDYPGDINFDKQGHTWLISQGLRLFDIEPAFNSYRKIFSNELYLNADFNWIPKTLAFDKRDNIWIGTNGGLKYYDRKKGKFSEFHSDINKDLDGAVIAGLSFDSFGNLWIATMAHGLLKYDEKSLLKSYSFNINDPTSLTQGWANQIFEATDGTILIATGGSDVYSGINFLNPLMGSIKRITYRQIQNRISGVSALWQMAPGEYALGVYNGAYLFSEKDHSLKKMEFPGIPDNANITYHLNDIKGNEWIASFQGLFKKEPGAQSFRKYDLSKINESNGLSNAITGLFESKKNGLWIITNNGLFQYNYETHQIIRHGSNKANGDVFITSDVNSFYEESDSILWVGTWQGGLNKYNLVTKRIKTYTLDCGLPSMSVQAILPDEKGHALWLSTFEGMSRFDLKTEQFYNYTLADGIQSQLFADGACLKTSRGLLIFGGSNGITVFNPEDVNRNSIPPKVFLTDLKLFNKSVLPGDQSVLKKPIYETKQITLSHNQNNLSIEFLALHYSNSALNKYSYKLENFDNEWRNVGNQRIAFYPNLPPGEFTFNVKAANDKGVWNEQGATLKIIVNPPWWRTTLAYIVYAVLIVVLGFAIDRYLRRRVLQKEREKNRARELQQAKEIEKAYHKLEEAYESLKTTQTQLIQSEKMASLGELTAGIAHEIQNPLNFVNNFSEVNSELIDEMEQEFKVGNSNEALIIANNIKENLKKIDFHGKRADAIVKGMLQHSRSSSGVKEPTDINALADEYLRLAYHGLRAKDKSFNATTKTDFAENVGKIDVIPQDIGRVILNLITNAFYAVTEKRQVAGEEYEPTVTVATRRSDNRVEIAVTDNGNGIPQRVMDKIFQPFFTTKPSGKGTGLGLSMSYDIVTKGHDGELRVETEENRYSRFRIILPTKN